MTYTRADTADGARVTLEMSSDDFASLLLLVGYAAGAARGRGDMHMFWKWLDFVNRMNTGNPEFMPYEIPEGALS